MLRAASLPPRAKVMAKAAMIIVMLLIRRPFNKVTSKPRCSIAATRVIRRISVRLMPPANLPPLDAQQAEGADLLREAQDSGAEIIGSAEVWGAFDGPLFLADVEGRALVVRPKTAIIATGAYERPTMVPGWTLPGVMTTGAAQTLWRSYRTLPGKRVLVCGSGPLNVQVALELAEGGASVAVVAEAAAEPWRHPWAVARAAMLDPALMAKGLGMKRNLRKRGIPLAYRTRLHRI